MEIGDVFWETERLKGSFPVATKPEGHKRRGKSPKGRLRSVAPSAEAAGRTSPSLMAY